MMTMRRLVSLGVLVASLATGAAAQGGRGDAGRTSYPIDRIVAVVGKRAITLTELYVQVNDSSARRQDAGLSPLNTADSLIYMDRILQGMIDVQLLLQKADEFKFVIKEEEIIAAVDQQIKQIREKRFPNERDFLEALKSNGINSVDELKRSFMDDERHRRLQKMTLDTLTKLGQMPQISVSERDVVQAFDSLKTQLGPRSATVSFRQIVLKPTPTDSADARAKALADSLVIVLRAGGNFDSLAAKFSDDTSNAKLGGDLGWFRRGAMVEPFDRMAFSMQIGQISSVVKTEFGYHIIRVDRLRPGEVKARHILITPRMNVGDLLRAHTKLEQLKDALAAGANFDSIADIYHDGVVHRRVVENRQLAELPPEYSKALDSVKVGQYSPVFDVVMPEGGMNKAGLMQLTMRNETGEWTLDEARERIRFNLRTAGSWRRLLDNLRKQTYVSVRLVPQPSRGNQ